MRPAKHRLLIGFAVAPAVGSLLVGLLVLGLGGGAELGLKIGGAVLLVFGYPATLLLGVPAYLVLRRSVTPTQAICAMIGAVVAAAPMVGLVTFAMLADGEASPGRWVAALTFAPALAAALGAIGGGAFWLASFWTTKISETR